MLDILGIKLILELWSIEVRTGKDIDDILKVLIS